jgi:U32 family peptidase
VNSVHPPELLSPAGNWECARAAVANGADAIYFGTPRFNARLRADNFTAEDLPKLMDFLHQHGVRGYCAFNTLIFTSELEDAADQLRMLESAGVDAVIVQDIGLARMVKALTPKLHLHASTQMTITSPEGLRFAKGLELDLAVLSRELSLRELERFQKDGNTLPLEVFVHGALCVAYSGQCLTSESLGRRSANRGECAQACRMPYELIVDGEKVDLADKRYLLSPQDLAAVQEIPRLVELGIRSFKIEGRLKSPEYVAAVTGVYRKAIDAAVGNLRSDISDFKGQSTDALDVSADQSSTSQVSKADHYALEMTFSRGLYPGWMHGVNHQELVGARFGKKRGAFIGCVSMVYEDAAEIDACAVPVKPGDGVVFENPTDTNDERGGYVFAVHGRVLEFQRGRIDMALIREGTRVYKTSDPALDKALQSTFKGDIPIRKQRELKLRVTGAVGVPLKVESLSESGAVLAEIESSMPLEEARNKPLGRETLEAQLSRLGGTPYHLGLLEVDLKGSVIVPLSELNRMRRALIERMEAGSSVPASPQEAPTAKSWKDLMSSGSSRSGDSQAAEPRLHTLCRSVEQIEAAQSAGAERIYIDFEDIRRFGDAVSQARERNAGSKIYLATPRIQKSGEEGFFKLIERAKPDGVLIRNLGAIDYFRASGLPMAGDFSLNVANPLTAEFLIKAGLESVTVSYDLNIGQVLALLQAAPAEWFELTLHQHMPMFHMEHCVFAAFMSKGTSFLDCGRPCEKHSVKLRDRVGMEHPLKADVGCRNTLFNATPQTGAQFFRDLESTGLRRFRVELLEEGKDESLKVIQAYQKLLSGQRTGETLWRDLRAHSQLGVTAGTLQER